MTENIYYEPKVEILEYNFPYCQYTRSCNGKPDNNTPFCESCLEEINSKYNYYPFDNTYGSKIKIKCPNNFKKIRQSDKYSDVEIRVGDTCFKSHRIVLSSASSYWESLFDTKTNINITDTTPLLFNKYLDFLYGAGVEFSQWRDLLDFCDYTQKTGILWRMNRVIYKLYVPCDEFIEFINRVSQVYDGKIPITLIDDLKYHLRIESAYQYPKTYKSDITSLNQELQSLLTKESYELTLKRFNNSTYYNEEYHLMFRVLPQSKKIYIGSYNNEGFNYSVNDLTPEEKKFCEENDLLYE